MLANTDAVGELFAALGALKIGLSVMLALVLAKQAVVAKSFAANAACNWDVLVRMDLSATWDMESELWSARISCDRVSFLLDRAKELRRGYEAKLTGGPVSNRVAAEFGT